MGIEMRLLLVVLMLCLVGADAAPVLGEEVHELSAEQAPEKDGETQKVAAEGAKAKKVVGVAKEKAKAATKVAEAAKQKAKEDAKIAKAAQKKLDKLKGSEANVKQKTEKVVEKLEKDTETLKEAEEKQQETKKKAKTTAQDAKKKSNKAQVLKGKVKVAV